MPYVLVWDIETAPDISGYAAANDLSKRLRPKSAKRWATSF